jgi:hypothetical protein
MRGSSGRSRRLRAARVLVVLLVVTAGEAAFAAAQSSAAPSVVPQVEIRVATQVTKTSATIEASINPEGGETSYEIFLTCQSASPANRVCEEPLTVAPQRVQGVIPADLEAHVVTAPVSGLQPGYLYDYSVIASNSAGREGYSGNGLITCPATGTCPQQPWMEGEALWVFESAQRWAEEAPRREAERQAVRREAEERLAREAAERARAEREIREAGELAGREAAAREAAAKQEAEAARRLRCVVPRLGGDSLAAARRALARAHCGLGKVTWPRAHHGKLVVGAQGVRSGRKLADAAKVSVTLRPARR